MNESDQNENLTTARKLVFSMLAKISNIDGTLDGEELRFALDLLTQTASDRDECLKAFATARRNHKSLLDYASEFVELGTTVFQREDAYSLIWRAAIADGILRATEKYLLHDTCIRLQLPPEDFDLNYRRYRRQFSDEEEND